MNKSTIDEVRQYAKQIGAVIDPDAWYRKMERNEWKDGSGRDIVNWHRFFDASDERARKEEKETEERQQATIACYPHVARAKCPLAALGDNYCGHLDEDCKTLVTEVHHMQGGVYLFDCPKGKNIYSCGLGKRHLRRDCLMGCNRKYCYMMSKEKNDADGMLKELRRGSTCTYSPKCAVYDFLYRDNLASIQSSKDEMRP